MPYENTTAYSAIALENAPTIERMLNPPHSDESNRSRTPLSWSNSEPEELQPEPEDSQLELEDPQQSIPEDSEQSISESKQRLRGQNWQSWEDRALVKEVTGVNPLTCEKGKTMEKWEIVSANLKKVGCIRTAKAIKDRFYKLLAEHRKNNLKSLQKTGTNEEISNFLYEMENLSSLAELQSRNPTLRAEAKDRTQRLNDEGKMIRQFAMESMSVVGSSRGGSQTPEPSNKKRKRRDINNIVEIMEEEAATYNARVRQLQIKEEERHAMLLEEQKKSTKLLENLCERLEQQQKAVQDNLEQQRKIAQEERQEFMDLFRQFLTRQ
ncbi:hypothetical protein BDZ91DRAFT_786702 [Kalaharituber pfeilii]|nr:hypothetical protein BDZ91DRAFT_786702 [Kalaharituber pfeilii]